MSCILFIVLSITPSSTSSYNASAQESQTNQGSYEARGCYGTETIEYEATNAVLGSIDTDVDFVTIIVGLENVTSDAKIVLKIPRGLVNVYYEFEVFVDGESSNHQEVNATQDYRTIAIALMPDAQEVEIVGSRIYYKPCPIAIDDKKVHLGVSGLVDGYYVEYDRELEATWNAAYFAFHIAEDNKTATLEFNITLNYVSDNPTSARIYKASDSNLSEQDRVSVIPTQGKLEYKESIALFTFFGYYPPEVSGAQLGNYSDAIERVFSLVPLAAKSIDDKTAVISFRDSFELRPDHVSSLPTIRVFDMQLSWVRIFEDDAGKEYYQWLQADDHCGGSYCPQHYVSVNEDHYGINGKFFAYYPIPEDVVDSSKGIGQDYVKRMQELAEASQEYDAMPSKDMLAECDRLGIAEEECDEKSILQKTPSQIPMSEEDRRRIENEQAEIGNSMYLIGIGAVIAGIVAFITLRKIK